MLPRRDAVAARVAAGEAREGGGHAWLGCPTRTDSVAIRAIKGLGHTKQWSGEPPQAELVVPRFRRSGATYYRTVTLTLTLLRRC